jgi:hypothetical protein
VIHFFKKKEIHQPDGIEIKQSALHGRGVFACKTFRARAVIETAPVILLEKADKEFLQSTSLFHYYFLVNDENIPVVLGLGYSSLYNHAPKANAVYSISIKEASLTITACKTIQPGEEITLNYNGNPDDETPVYFPPEPTV